jgi:hypothetical protein
MIPRFHVAGVLFSSWAGGWTLSRIRSFLFVSSRAVSFGSGSLFFFSLLVYEYGSEQLCGSQITLIKIASTRELAAACHTSVEWIVHDIFLQL